MGGTLNVRSTPDANAPVVGKLNNRQVVIVYEIEGQWARIIHEGQHAYVNASYLVAIPQQQTPSGREKERGMASGGAAWFLYILAGMLVIGYILWENNEDSVGSLTCLLLLFCAELAYFFLFDFLFPDFRVNGPMWFSDPHTVGFFTGIVTGFLFYCFIGLQLYVSVNVMEDYFDDELGMGAAAMGIGAFLMGLEFFSLFVTLGYIVGGIGCVLLLVEIYKILFILGERYTWPKFFDALLYASGSVAAAILVHYTPGQVMYVIDYLAR